MRYDNSGVRRQDRLLDEARARELLRRGEYGILSMQEPDGGGYGIPVSYVWDGAEHIYIHCAPEGHKLRCLARCTRVSLCVVGDTRVAPERFTTAYESVVVQAEARTELDPEERMEALRLLVEKYAPDHVQTGMRYAGKSFHRTAVIRLDGLRASGKCKIVK